jgi:hypothetical protein
MSRFAKTKKSAWTHCVASSALAVSIELFLFLKVDLTDGPVPTCCGRATMTIIDPTERHFGPDVPGKFIFLCHKVPFNLVKK